MEVVLRVLFLGVIRPAGVVLRRRDALRLRQPASTNWRPARR